MIPYNNDMMDIRLSNKIDQRQQLSMLQIRSLELLAMDVQSLSTFLKNEYLENPLFDCTDVHIPERSGSLPLQSLGHTVTYGQSYDDIIRASDNKDIPVKKTDELRESLKDQLPAGLGEDELRLFDYLISHMESSGYLPYTATELSNESGIAEETIASALCMLRELEPCGICAYDLRDCLLQQLRKKGRMGSTAWNIADRYLSELASGNIGRISRGLSVSTAEVRKAIEELTGLEPHPANGFTDKDTDYMIPDIIIRYDSNDMHAELNDHWIEDYHLNDHYMELMKNTEDAELKEYFSSKLERARQIMSGIRQRRRTLQQIADKLLKIQHAYFLENEAPVPLSMSELAEQLEISTSTVSRAVKGKYISSRRGIIPARELFVARASKSKDNAQSDAELSAEAIKALLRSLIDAEDRSDPLSDRRLSELLLEKGIKLSRRTVAKYRESLNIPQSFDRK